MPIDFKKYPLPARTRHHTAPNLYIKFDELEGKNDNYPPLYPSINWNELFADGKPPKILDVGCGKGKLLFETSEKYPEKNILGIEVREWATEWINNVIIGEDIGNCHSLWYSVVNGIGFIEDNSIDEIYYLFPDPWPKRKHHKRRAFNSETLNEYARILNKNGKIYLATDVPEVHNYHIEVLKANKFLDFEIIKDDSLWGLPITNKERFCRLNDIHFDRIIAKLK